MNNLKKAAALTLMAGGIVAGSAGTAAADAISPGHAVNSPGALSGNNVQLPVHVPANVTGDTVSVVGLLNPAFDNVSVND